MTKDQTPVHNTVSLGKFAKRVASAVVRFLDVSLPLSFVISAVHIRCFNLLPTFQLFFRSLTTFKGKIQTGGSALEGSQRSRSFSSGSFTSRKGAGSRSYN
jgi:hypothetical protein